MKIHTHAPYVHAPRHLHAASAAASTASSAKGKSKPDAASALTGDNVQISAAAVQASDAHRDTTSANQK
jgi:hypothetical protein